MRAALETLLPSAYPQIYSGDFPRLCECDYILHERCSVVGTHALPSPYIMTYALEGGGGTQKADKRKGDCVIVTVTRGEGVKKSEIFPDVI